MFEFPDQHNPFYVLVGIIVAQLFMYGRKIKERVKIRSNEIVADVMQFGVMFVVTMGFLELAKTITGWDLADPWQLVTVVILFNMSFDTWFNRLRDMFNTKAGAAFDVLLGRKIAVGQGDDAPMRNPNRPEGQPPDPAQAAGVRAVYKKPPPDNPELNATIEKLNDVP